MWTSSRFSSSLTLEFERGGGEVRHADARICSKHCTVCSRSRAYSHATRKHRWNMSCDSCCIRRQLWQAAVSIYPPVPAQRVEAHGAVGRTYGRGRKISIFPSRCCRSGNPSPWCGSLSMPEQQAGHVVRQQELKDWKRSQAEMEREAFRRRFCIREQSAAIGVSPLPQGVDVSEAFTHTSSKPRNFSTPLSR